MIDKNKINELLNQSKADEQTRQKINSFVSNMNDEDVAKLNSVLNDKKTVQQLLNSPQAQELIKKFQSGK